MQKFFFSAALSALTIFAAPLSAQEQIGTITCDIAGTQQQWFLTRDGGESQSAWEDQNVMALIDLFGHTTPDTVTDTNNALTLTIMLMGPMNSPMMTSQEIIIRGDDDDTRNLRGTNNDPETKLVLENISQEGDNLAFKAQISGRLFATTDGFFTVDADSRQDITCDIDALVPAKD